MPFTSLIQIERAKSSQSADKPIRKDKRGCDFCPLNEVKGINKVFGKVKGRDIFIWAQSPGMKENKEEKELIGPSGKWLWEELRRVGINREDCDIQNVVRCVPADRVKGTWPPLQMRAPTKIEVKCCSIYNEQALEKSKAKLHLVFGQVAAASVLQKEFKKDKRVFYSDNLQGWVIFLDHPSYFIRQGFQAGVKKQPTASLVRFREDLDKAKSLLKHKSFDRFKFIKDQEYIGVNTTKLARIAYRRLVRAAKKGIRLVADMEEGSVDEKGRPDDNGKRVALCCGFTARPGTTYVFALEHPDSKASTRCKRLNRKLVRRLLRYADIKKAFHYGSSDCDAVERLLKTTVKGFDYDTLLGEYFDDPDGYAFGLDAVSQRYADFSDYKDIIGPDAFTDEYQALWEAQKGKQKKNLGQAVDDAKRKGKINLARLPWPKLVMYNGADCHLAALSMKRTSKVVNPPLMRAYVDSSFILYRMQRERACQPLFDYDWYPYINKLLSVRIKQADRRVKRLAGKYAYIEHKKTGEIIKKPFNPGSGDHIKWLLYTKLKYRFVGKDPKDKPNTKADTLERLALRHPKVMYILEFRRAKKAKSTYTKGYYNCAKKNEGHLRTKWKQTGTSTGRLSSGKDKNSNDTGVVNLQNIHGDELIKCLLISDPRWRKIWKHFRRVGKFTEKTWKKFANVFVFLGSDFSQNELRQLAEEAGDKELQRIFSSREKWKCDVCGEMHSADPHVEVGHALTGWSKGKIHHNDRIRKFVKNMQFGLVYGLQGHGLYMFLVARGVKTTEEEVNKYHARYFHRFKGVKRLQAHYREFTKKHGYVVNQFGFRRKLNVTEDQDYNPDKKKGPYWGNQAINTPIQGAAHQLLMFALAVLHRKKNAYKLLKYPQLEIHDALYFRTKLKYLWKAIKQASKLLTVEPLRVTEEDFGIKKKVSLVAKPKAGFRFGVQIEGIEDMKPWEFLNAWCEANGLLQKDYKKQLAELY